MQLPADFPHTRREQYLVALPHELRSRAERLAALAVLYRAQLFYDERAEKAFSELAARGYSDEDIARAITPRLPAALRPPDDGTFGAESP
jgi:hypothetical protein